jgi:hypothetical protein
MFNSLRHNSSASPQTEAVPDRAALVIRAPAPAPLAGVSFVGLLRIPYVSELAGFRAGWTV